MAITTQGRSVITLVVITFVLFFIIIPANAVKVGGAISISAVYTTDGAFSTKTTFSPGDTIDYHVDVYNNSGIEIPVDIRFYVFPNSWDPSLYGFDYTVHLDKMPLGLSRFYTPTSLPGYSKPFYYFLRISVTPSKSVPLPDDAGDEVDGNFTIQSPTPMARSPAGKAPNLIVLVHGCCTDQNDLMEWDGLGNKITQQLPNATSWEIVVWDWTKDAGTLPGPAYQNAFNQSLNLSLAIAHNKYEYIHLIGHSAGARLVDLAAARLVDYYTNSPPGTVKPFINLTLLDAYTVSDTDKQTFGDLGKYSHYNSEHYVYRGDPINVTWSTDACLAASFNFDLTAWNPITEFEKNGFSVGHQFPRYWYDQSVSAGFQYGYKLSLEGNGKKVGDLDALYQSYPKGKQCPLSGDAADCKPQSCW
jgi:hypothetical protein